MSKNLSCAAVAVFLYSSWATAQLPELTNEDYRRAERFLPANLDKQVRNGEVRFGWQEDADKLWYRRTTPAGAQEFVQVDAASGKEVVLSEPPPGAAAPTDEDRVRSPDGRMEAFLKDFNLWVRIRATGDEYALTEDGVIHHAYAAYGGDALRWVTIRRRELPDPPQVVWSPDSRYLLTHRLDERQVRETHLLDSIPKDGSSLPQLYSYRYPVPGDEHVPMATPIIFDVERRKRIDVRVAPMVAALVTPAAVGDAWWARDSRSVYLLERDRYARSHVLRQVDIATGSAREIMAETGKTFLALSGFFGSRVHALGNGDILWSSERDGWNHLYYYKSDGTLRNQITRGNWLVHSIVRIDERARKIYFMAGGREAGRNPYFAHLYVVGFDGTQLELLTPENANHEQVPDVSAQRRADRTPAGSGSFSSSGRFFLDRFSTPQQPPQIVLRTADGKLVRELVSADISVLRAGGFVAPESFEVAAADGKTPIYGNLYRPSTFDATRRYPVIDAIYPGPQSIRSRWSFGAAVFDSNAAQAFAELGFIVVTIDGRGTPLRSKAFWNESYARMEAAGTLEDHIAGLRQLAQRYPYLDLDKVAIYGISGGGYASSRAILNYPDFFKVAVAAAGDHEQSAYQSMWAEFFQGPGADYKQLDNARFASALKGKLLLVHGDLDDNVHPSQTLRLVDALVKAGRPVDLAIIPGANHGDVAFGMHPWVFRYTADYFVRHLLGTEPPAWQ